VTPITALVADDQPVVRSGFRTILEAHDDLRVVAEAANGQEAVDLAGELHPDVVLMDVRMPEMDGIEATRRICAVGERAPRVLVLTTFDLDEYVLAALRAGASGFLLKDVPRDELAQAVRVVARGDALLGPSVTRRLIGQLLERPSTELSDPRPNELAPVALATLTAREHEVLGLLARGSSNAEIAAELYVSEATVKTHVAHVLMKLDLRDRVQAVIFAYECGVVRIGDLGGPDPSP
jgi:DNA-binding NarL/FixJ family response regulator